MKHNLPSRHRVNKDFAGDETTPLSAFVAKQLARGGSAGPHSKRACLKLNGNYQGASRKLEAGELTPAPWRPIRLQSAQRGGGCSEAAAEDKANCVPLTPPGVADSSKLQCAAQQAPMRAHFGKEIR